MPPRQESGGRGAGREEGGWWHPRRARSADPLLVPPLQTAASKFQALQRVYAVLADPAKRQAYDRTGCLADAEDLAGESFDGLYSFFRSMYKKVEEADLDAYEDAFRGSAEEEGELLELHARFKGDMDAVFDWLPCSDPARDAHRFAGAVRAAVKEGKVAASKAFDAWAAKKVDGVPAPAHPLAPRARRPAAAASGPLALIAARAKAGAGLAGVIAGIEARAGAKPGKRAPRGGRGSKEDEEPSDADFEAAAARLAARKKRRVRV